ncbi:MAG: glycosyltransferase family 2 protein [Selenomonas sp.]|uniref:glycosyltransferase family A protein n=1 Tax=Selenomonas sp. TaxID=2053611 RepID=UPI0025CCC008|nr:glycosyltransferase family A protein [Selenomonas sp.]MCI6086300.1 glycosyltransferase family 2 protein [Selenomonas sp.]
MKQEEAVKVSVLVPVYNVKPYLHECLDSLAAQTLDSMEFVAQSFFLWDEQSPAG